MKSKEFKEFDSISFLFLIFFAILFTVALSKHENLIEVLLLSILALNYYSTY